MTHYAEEDYLQLSGIQHFAFCRRQWALLYIEQSWEDNLRTVEGNIVHERVHDGDIYEKRGDIITVRALPVHSREMGVSGECDVVEFRRDDRSGVKINGYDGKYSVIPVEYKRGEPKKDDIDSLQLVAQAICLLEMFCCEIPFGQLYYAATRRRADVEIGEEQRNKAKEYFAEMHQYFKRRHTPGAKRTKSCNACSLSDICLPVICGRKSAKQYIDESIRGGGCG